ncbi:hypothetical protein [Catellatospora citrea]|uniref:Uncharacterized protein n=1 Tax=Catellatospora citrea TaxID=53366 RepID=A0A8J3KF67_9ACTN|nr:hypothetical protein [Catellatospora citrea]RKE06519.1 hypothetical protein C8E86_1339 [Catellatospora citrea]GIG01823.1 hypothetical protein Cci01nite_69160 [Catellatospora citrea]
MQETARAIGHRLRITTTMISLMLFLIAGLTVMAQPQRASAAPLTEPVSVSTQEPAASALDGGKRCWKQTHHRNHHRYVTWKCRHDNHHRYHHKNNHHNNGNNHHGNNHHGYNNHR